jgi:hypothetical protein
MKPEPRPAGYVANAPPQRPDVRDKEDKEEKEEKYPCGITP